MSETKLKWGILGAGAIADAFVRGVQMGQTGEVVAVGSRSLEKAGPFAERFRIPRTYGSYEDLLADDSVDVIYIATPHPIHPEWAIKAVHAGRHVLCEKPLALNHAQAMAMIEAVREHGVFFMEAFMYRCHPQTYRLVELLRDGVIGEVKLVRASFGFSARFDPDSRLFSNSLGGGGIMDVGCHTVSMSRLIAGAVEAKPFADPLTVQGQGVLTTTGVDSSAVATLGFANGILAEVSTSVQVNLGNLVEIFGSEGRITLPNPWLINRVEAEEGVIEVHRGGSEVQEIRIPADRTSFSYEADEVAKAIVAGRQKPGTPAMSWEDSLGNIATLDRWRHGVGVVFVAETPEGQSNRTVANRPITRRHNANMHYARIDGIDKNISMMVMGCDNQQTFAHAAVMFDDWMERGGNAFDTAHIYADGLQERLLGHWIHARGVRDEVVIIGKGAHAPHCNPEALSLQLIESLDRLQTDHVDLYLLHRDNLDIPVDEFVDVLNEHASAGRIRVFGGSNWSLDRIAEANAYAKQAGKQGFGVLSDNLSLAESVKPLWSGCQSVSDSASRHQLAEWGLPNFAWSSQARGYFLPEQLRMRLGLDNFKTWDSPLNQARRLRAYELAEKYGVSPINIAAAYVLCQPFPSFALIGPRTIHETVTSLPALDIELTQDEINWLWGTR